MLCQFHGYSKVIQFSMYMYLFFFKFFSHLGFCITLSTDLENEFRVVGERVGEGIVREFGIDMHWSF